MPFGYTEWWLGDVFYSGQTCRADDADCDRWPDTVDNCPFVFNPDQADGNDDGVGDACPLCPCDPNNDIDGDAVCACSPVDNKYCKNVCATATVDNCPFVFNDQSNCNAEAEAARGAPAWGDACDPVPCPKSSAPLVTSVPGGGTCGNEAFGRQIRNTIQTQTIGSNTSESLVEASNLPVLTPGPQPLVVSSVVTDSRFCQSNVSLITPYDCHDLKFSIADAQLGFDVAQQPLHPWHKISLSGTNATGRGGQWTGNYGIDVNTQTWDYVSDNAFWTTGSSPLIPAPDSSYAAMCTSSTYGSGTCLNGTFWSHAESLVGSAADSDLVRGTHVGVHAPGLANHYFDLAPDEAVRVPGRPCPRIVPQPCSGGACVASRFRWAWSMDPFERYQWTADPELGMLISLSTTPGVQLLQNGSKVVDVSQVVSTRLTTRMSDSTLLWTSAVEPGLRTGQLGLDVVAIALASGGLVADVALARSGSLLSVSEQEAVQPPFVGAPPIARNGFQAVFTRTAGTLFELGGVDPVTQVPLHDMWMQVTAQKWAQLQVAGYVPTTVLASTYSFADRRLWVLDHALDSSHVDQLRLVRIDPYAAFGSTAQLVLQQPAEAAADAYFLGVDRDGTVLFTVASPAGSVTSRVTFGQTPPLQAIHTEPGVLLHAPFVDEFGYSFIIQNSDGTWAVQRHTSLTGGCCDAGLFIATLPAAGLYARAGITLGDRSAALHASGGYSQLDNGGGPVNLGTSAVVGNVLSLGPIALANGSKINGTAASTGAITLGAGSQVTGTSAPFSLITLPPTPSMQVVFPPATQGDVNVEPSNTRILLPGAYGNVVIKSRATLSLSAGVYTFASLDLEPQATLSLSQSGGATTIDLQNSIIFRGAVTRSPSLSTPFLIAYFGTQDAVVEAGFTGAFFAPNANLVLGANVPTVFIGQYVAATIRTRPDTTIVF